MGMYTYLSQNDFERYSTVDDKELNELFQEVRELMPDVYINFYKWEEKRWFRKPIERFYCSVYHRQDKGKIASMEEVRCLNLNFTTLSNIDNYLYGLINGYLFHKQNIK